MSNLSDFIGQTPSTGDLEVELLSGEHLGTGQGSTVFTLASGTWNDIFTSGEYAYIEVQLLGQNAQLVNSNRISITDILNETTLRFGQNQVGASVAALGVGDLGAEILDYNTGDIRIGQGAGYINTSFRVVGIRAQQTLVDPDTVPVEDLEVTLFARQSNLTGIAPYNLDNSQTWDALPALGVEKVRFDLILDITGSNDHAPQSYFVDMADILNATTDQVLVRHEHGAAILDIFVSDETTGTFTVGGFSTIDTYDIKVVGLKTQKTVITGDVPVDNTGVADGDILAWNNTNGQYEPQANSAGLTVPTERAILNGSLYSNLTGTPASADWVTGTGHSASFVTIGGPGNIDLTLDAGFYVGSIQIQISSTNTSTGNAEQIVRVLYDWAGLTEVESGRAFNEVVQHVNDGGLDSYTVPVHLSLATQKTFNLDFSINGALPQADTQVTTSVLELIKLV